MELNKNKKTFSITILLSLLIVINSYSQNQEGTDKVNKSEQLIANLMDASNEEVIVIAHRGDWRNAPENSIQAIQNCINMGVDMVEIDVQATKDGKLVLMHDKTIDRTTNGSGKVADWTFDELQSLWLKDGLGQLTAQKIPSLKEALLTAKGNILVNLDKSYPIFEKCYEIIQMTGTEKQVIIKGKKTRAQVEKEFGSYLDKVHFMPVIKLSNPKAAEIVSEYMISNPNPPVAFEFIFRDDTYIDTVNFKAIREAGYGVWVNSLWPNLNGGHHDESAVFDDKIYQWYLDNHIDMIQTDRPQLLLNYLRKKGKHL
ncbi:glycerophosphodiester phosphodiesterase family protein [uncultured Polaribacter sp.]|uniref:glycerophosphodiester phosphodiesterase family protein n=1 Tax=uncultured Polaribacter sp. TaxID=174711 RepID=UPI00261173C1|nr:glycerophosphodiester phosphodiesterase family protein [uncultured Polaribacter sp.]